jgi:hypothetical protein
MGGDIFKPPKIEEGATEKNEFKVISALFIFLFT